MNPERLQVMKELAEEACPFIFKDAMLELIAELEEAWQDIATQNADLGKIIEDTTVQLEASQQELAELLDTKREFIKAKPLRKQLVIANDHNELLERIIDGYRSGYKEFKDDFAKTRIRLEAELAAAQAEVARLEDELDWVVRLTENPNFRCRYTQNQMIAFLEIIRNHIAGDKE